MTGDIKYELKSQVSSTNETYFRYVVSRETPSKPPTDEPILKTYRLRHVINGWKYKGIDMSVHITFRTEIDISQTEQLFKRVSSYTSIEIELPSGANPKPNTLREIADQILLLHNGWKVPNLSDTISSAKNTLKGIIPHPGKLQKPLDLQWNEITYNHLISNPHAITFKADGVRMLLLLTSGGSFLVDSFLNLIPLNVSDNRRVLLVDGELINNILWVFDIIYDDKDYQKESYRTRHKYLSSVLSKISSIESPIGNIEIKVKPIHVPNNTEEFFKDMNDILNNTTERSDGAILTPINQEYSKSVLKYKEPKNLTVDFFIGSKGGLYVFKDNDLYLLEGISGQKIPKDAIGTIAEFKYINPTTWEYVRERRDKATPNNEKVYTSILRLQEDPITRDVITGKSLRLMRKYHNRMKSKVYQYLQLKGVRSVTDIGSGRGGDISKWVENKLDIQAIEPNKDNVKELIRRAESMGADIDECSDKSIMISLDRSCINLFNIEAEDLYRENLNVNNTDAITFFNSATFFGPKALPCIINSVTIENAYLVLMVIDGKRLKSISSDPNKLSPLISISDIPCKSEDVYDLGCISIKIEDSSTVREVQEENLVNVESLLKILELDGWVLDTDQYLTSEKLLGPVETLYTSAQRLIIMKRSVLGTGFIERPLYKTLDVDKEQIISTPYGDLIRIGVLAQGIDITKNYSLLHSILYVSSDAYRKANGNTQSKYATRILEVIGMKNPIFNALRKGTTKLYLVPQNSWDMYEINFNNMNTAIKYSPYTKDRDKGIVLMINEYQWEPLVKKGIYGNIEYIW